MYRQIMKLISLYRAWKSTSETMWCEIWSKKIILQKSCPMQCVLHCQILDVIKTLPLQLRAFLEITRWEVRKWLLWVASLVQRMNGNHLPIATPKLWTRNSREGSVFAIPYRCIDARIFPNISELKTMSHGLLSFSRAIRRYQFRKVRFRIRVST